MDGGNSVAIKGSKFSKSTGDSGGDKKGVASGTIEGEAEFISASPTVKFEGAGVCRLSDQMTMNKANTMCLGGAQNPSVTVTEDAEGTYTVDVKCRYPDSTAFKNADFDITDAPEPGEPDYRTAWIEKVTAYNEKKDHPFCHGIQMDTHHLVSEKALDGCDDDLKEMLIDKGYNINYLGNLVGIPATFKGACHLGVQVHRSDHKFKKKTIR